MPDLFFKVFFLKYFHYVFFTNTLLCRLSSVSGISSQVMQHNLKTFCLKVIVLKRKVLPLFYES